ncbi:MAG TPA: hypothetical protein EYM69_01565 [Dehalococcoidia bacterium]|nr:hypothetical protein [Dehalococcoidia bacterium]
MTTSEKPSRLGALHALHVQSGANMIDVAGWQVVHGYADSEEESEAVTRSAGVCDISGRSVVNIKSVRLDDVLGERSPTIGSVHRDGDSLIARLTTEEALAIGPPSAVDSWKAGISPTGDPRRYITDVTSGLEGIKIVGPRAREVIASLTDLDLRENHTPNNSCAQAGFAQVHATLLRIDITNTTPSYELYVAREYGVYMWEVVLESLGPGAVVPFGDAALRRLQQQGQGG